MSFSFNFELTEEDYYLPGQSTTVCNGSSVKVPVECKTENLQVKSKVPAFEVKSFYDDSVISKLETRVLIVNDHVLEIVDTSKLEQLMSNDKEFQSLVSKSSSLGDIVSHSDLVDGVYEGGLKVWECGIDLAKYLSSHSSKSTVEIKRKKVLEIGCGAGLPGLYCVKCGASRVDFQDYNVEVLKLLTHTNVAISSKQHDESSKETECHYFAGDWEEFRNMDQNNERYDLILSAETIYNVENYPKLHKIFDKMLAVNGVILIAAKEYYFGVGGGVDSFLEYVNGQNCFEYETVWETKTGVPRRILMLKRRDTQTILNVT